MAENKKSFVLYADLIHTVRKMPTDKAGELLLTILSYVNDENPTVDDMVVSLVFEPIRQQLKRDLVKWVEIKGKRSDAGRASAESKKQQKEQMSTSVESVEQSSTKSTVSVNDSVTVNDNVNAIKSLTGVEHFQHMKDFLSIPYPEHKTGFISMYTEKEYTSFKKFLESMLKEFEVELVEKFDKCISIGDWKKYLKSSSWMVVRPALVKTLGAAGGDRKNMAARIATYSGDLFNEKVFVK